MTSIVYVLTNPGMPGLVKIGMTGNEDAETRIGQLYGSGVPFPFKLEFACRVANAEEVERALHTAFAPWRPNPKREFFSIEPGQAIAILKLLHVQDATSELTPASTSEVGQDLAAGEEYRRTRRPNLNFVEMGIPIGAELISTANGAVVKVVTDKKVEINGQECSLTAATRQVLGLDYSVAPAPYWTYAGRLLKDIYEETYPDIGD